MRKYLRARARFILKLYGTSKINRKRMSENGKGIIPSIFAEHWRELLSLDTLLAALHKRNAQAKRGARHV